MNVTRENLGELDLSIRVNIEENDYKERVAKQLKDYQKKATVPGFRKGMAPMGMIQRMYKTAVVADEVQNMLGEVLYKYIDDEKLNIIGSPLNNDEKTGAIDFAKQTDFTFYFDAALAPAVNIAWDKVGVKMHQIETTAEDVDKQIEDITKRFGKFETPETISEADTVYGKVVELAKGGAVKEGGINTFASFDIATIKDDAIKAQFVGKKAQDKVTFAANKAFAAADIEKNFRLESDVAKKFKSEVEFTISGCSRITPRELNEELFAQVFPDEDIKDVEQFRTKVQEAINKANDEQCEILFVNQVRKELLEHFDAALPEAFLKRWILSRSNDEKVTAETIEAEWAEKYLPSLKWEILDAELNKVQSIEPTAEEVINYIKDILRKNDTKEEGEDDAAQDARLTKTARTIASDKANVQQILDKLYVQKTAALFKEQVKPAVEKVDAKKFAEICKA